MSRIEVGDLVVCIAPWPCCGYPVGVGLITTVEGIGSLEGVCGQCGHAFPSEPCLIAHGGRSRALMSRFKKIPPLVELVTDEERIEA